MKEISQKEREDKKENNAIKKLEDETNKKKLNC